jgi:hypothetical protein
MNQPLAKNSVTVPKSAIAIPVPIPEPEPTASVGLDIDPLVKLER